jgi:hypothetical protein
VTSANCRAVLDTNVLVAAAYSPDSASRRVVEVCLDGERTAVVSPALRLEHEVALTVGGSTGCCASTAC